MPSNSESPLPNLFDVVSTYTEAKAYTKGTSKTELVCALSGCGKLFVPARAGNQRKYCSNRCAKIYSYRRNIDKYKTAAKTYRLSNLEKYKLRGKQFYEANKSARLAYAKQWKTARRLNQPWIPAIEATKQRAKIKGIPFELTFEWGKKRWTGFCELTGLPFTIGHRGKPGAGFFSPSIDKIESNKGYTPANCRFVLHCVNTFKFTGTDEQMYLVAEALIKNKARINSDHTD